MRGGWKRPFWKTGPRLRAIFLPVGLVLPGMVELGAPGGPGLQWPGLAQRPRAPAGPGSHTGAWCAAMRAVVCWAGRSQGRLRPADTDSPGVVYRLGQGLCWSPDRGAGFCPVMAVSRANLAMVAGAQTVNRAAWTEILVRRAMR